MKGVEFIRQKVTGQFSKKSWCVKHQKCNLRDLSDFDKGQILTARLGQSIMVGLVRCS